MACRVLSIGLAAGALLFAKADDAAAGGGVEGIDVASTVRLAAEVIERYMAPLPSGEEPESETDERDGTNDTAQRRLQEQSESDQPPAEAAAEELDAAAAAEGGKEEDEDKNISYDGSDLVEWINSNGGFVHPNTRIGLDPTGSYRGVFVKDAEDGDEGGGGIEDDDIIAKIPWDLIVKPPNYASNIYWSCEAPRELHEQFILGDKSKHAPYINYLKNMPRGRMLDEWSIEGKEMLNKLLGHDFEDDEEGGVGLPPRYHKKNFEETWINECGYEDSDLARAAFYQFTSRDEDTLMIPFWDMHNHSNDPKKLNTITLKPSNPGKPVILRATRDINPGEQVFISYNPCHACWFDETYEGCTSYSHYGTPELFDIFGFVEDFPQMWQFRMKVSPYGEEFWDDVKICLERADDAHPDGGGRLVVTFGDNYVKDEKKEMPLEENIKYFGREMSRLGEMEVEMKGDRKLMETIPRHEWDMIWRYHEALMTAMSSAVLASDFAYLADAEAKSEEEGSQDDDSEDDSGDESEDGSEDESEDDSDDESKDGSEVEEGGQVKPAKFKTLSKGSEGGRDEL